IILITKKSHQQSHLKTDRTYNQLFHKHKNIFTASIILVILALPRLIISFVSKSEMSIAVENLPR
ncbi:unnamed protein product, partial [Rotaria sp. Silwood2]